MSIFYSVDEPRKEFIRFEDGKLILSGWSFSTVSKLTSVEVFIGSKKVDAEFGFDRFDVNAAYKSYGDISLKSGFRVAVPINKISIFSCKKIYVVFSASNEVKKSESISINQKTLLKQKIKNSFIYRILHVDFFRHCFKYFRQNGFLCTFRHSVQYIKTSLKNKKDPYLVKSNIGRNSFESEAIAKQIYEKDPNHLLKIEKEMLKAEVVSFDIFDTLLCRLVAKPTDIFRIMEEQLGIKGFAELREKSQFEASVFIENLKGFPHCVLDDVYDYIKSHSKMTIDWDYVKDFELKLEDRFLVLNPQMKELYDVAVKNRKRIIAVSDMYIHSDFLKNKLVKSGFDKIDKIYVSSDCHKAKFRNNLFQYVLKQEGITAANLFHIGDNINDDFEFPKKLGIKAFHYKRNPSILYPSIFESISKGILNVTSKSNDDFFYRLGVNVGGPLYAYLLDWLLTFRKTLNNRKLFFLARDGYNLFNVCKNLGITNIEYLYSSRRALLLAGVDSVQDEVLNRLPPFTFGQSVKEILDYLCIDFVTLPILKNAGFNSFDDLILGFDDFAKFRNIYKICKEPFLALCAKEREYAKSYLKEVGFLDSDSVVFDCGWNGSSQFLLNKVLEKIGTDVNYEFVYAGIFDNAKSRKQLSNLKFKTCFFGLDSNTDIASAVKDSIVIFELFFSSPENSVLRYLEGGKFEFEKIEPQNKNKENILKGISDFLSYYKKITVDFSFNISVKDAIEHLLRLMKRPLMLEASIIGDIVNVDGFVAKKSEKKYLARITEKQIRSQNYFDFYWPAGIIAHPKNSKFVKNYVFGKFNDIFYLPEELNNEQVCFNIDYETWIKKNEVNITDIYKLNYSPSFSVVVPVYNVLSSELRECIDSVCNQTYKNWELCLVDDASTWKNVKFVLDTYSNNPKIKIAYHKENGHISKTTNDAIKMATGEFIAFLDCDDVLAPNALFEMAKMLNEDSSLDFIYSDEDKLSLDGKVRRNPFFKPDWSPDTFMSLMYTCHFSIYRKSIVDEIGGLTEGLDGAQDYDFTLRFTEKTSKIGHVSKILYHWRERPQSIASNPEAKPYALLAIKKLKEEALKRRNLIGDVVYCNDVFQYRIKYRDPTMPLVSIIIPSKDHFDIFERCIKSIRSVTTYKNYEIIVVDNGSSDINKKKYLAASELYSFKYIYKQMNFNFSRMCNLGAATASGKVFVFLNNDIEVSQADWLEILVGQTTVKTTGAVGAKLLYPKSDIIQHAGVVNLDIGPSHAFIGFPDKAVYYYCINRLDYNFSAVTAACLAIRRENYEVVGGFDENLPVAYNDVDFCFKLVEKGFFNVLRNDVILTHHESISRGVDDADNEKMKRLKLEREYLYKKHPSFFHYDPFYNHNLTQNRCDFQINL